MTSNHLLRLAMTPTNSFFDESREQSEVKTHIVSMYFKVWAQVVAPSAKKVDRRLAYIDLFAGPGRYRDGKPSTPILVLQEAVKNPDMQEMLVTYFNDRNAESVESLRGLISELPGVEKLRHKPQVQNEEVGSEIVKLFEKAEFVPTLFFVDPWGYKGLSLALISSVLKNWGCDCIFFFNYNRINAGLNNTVVRSHMSELFGESRANAIRRKLEGLAPPERETLILEELSEALREKGAMYVLPFTFKNSEGTRTTHHLIFVTKSFKGYEIMKGIMARASSNREQGVATFEYSPASKKYPLLFELSRPLDDLAEMLLDKFQNQKLAMRRIYERHSVGRPYLESDYKRVLASLEAGGKLIAEPPAAKRRPGTFAGRVLVSFPKRITP